MAAEISRELGDFARAAELLNFPFPEDYEDAVNQIKALNDKKDFTVRKVE